MANIDAICQACDPKVQAVFGPGGTRQSEVIAGDLLVSDQCFVRDEIRFLNNGRLIFVPIVLPMVKQLGIDITWFSILVAVNLQTAWLSPPVALSAYVLKGVAPQWSLGDIYRGMMQFMVLQIVGLALVMIFPQIALWLPGVLYTR